MKGFLRIPNTLRYSSEFTLIEKWLLAVIGSWADGCRVPQAQLAAELGVTPRWLIEIIKSLKERGAITSERESGNANVMRLTSEFSSRYMCSQFTSNVNSVHISSEVSSQLPHYINNKDNRKKKENGATAPKHPIPNL
jgi:DNA-binding MarR family transcriptional regulator